MGLAAAWQTLAGTVGGLKQRDPLRSTDGSASRRSNLLLYRRWLFREGSAMMRPVILGLCFCAGTTAFCQSTVPAPTTPERLGADLQL